MRFAILENDIVVNVAEAAQDFGLAQGWIASDVAQIGDSHDNGTFTKPAPVVAVPQSVLMRQARDAIILAGKDDEVEAAIDGIEDLTTRKRVRSAWEYSGEVQRNNAFVLMLTPALGGSEAVDALFIAAEAL